MDLLRLAVLVAAAALTAGGGWRGGRGVEASIHTYDREPFREVGNAFLLSGGSEGIVSDGADGADPTSSFIKFVNVTFWRTSEAAGSHAKMAHSTGLVQAILFEAAGRDNIGGSVYGGQRSICCTPDLAKLEGCKQGEVIRRPSSNDPDWPMVLDTHFSGDHISVKLDDDEARRSSVKLDIYRKFTNALAVSVIASVAWIGYEVYFKATDPFSERWQSAWIITAFWHILAFVLLVVICYLWAPSQSSQRHAYSGEAADDDDEESQFLTKGTDSEVGMVKIDKDRNAGVSHAFILEDEAEEDKRE